MASELHPYREQFIVKNLSRDVPEAERISVALKHHYGDTLTQIHGIEASGDTWNVRLTTSEKGFLFGSAQCIDTDVGFLLVGGITT